MKTTETILNEAGFYPEYLEAPNGDLVVVSHLSRCYSSRFSVFMVRIKDGEITYESHVRSHWFKADALYNQRKISKGVRAS